MARPVPPRRERRVKRLAVIAAIGMFLVLMMGSTVTNTGSGEGCGRSWPLCKGEFVPAYAVETAIEFSHRLVTAAEGILILATAVGAILIRRGDRFVKILVGIMVGTLLFQSGLGAAAVMWPQSPALLASHFGVSMTCFAAIFLLTRYLYETAPDAATVRSRPRPPLPRWLVWATWGALVGSVVVAYIGAYMRHSGNELACVTWPRCNGETFPGFAGPEGIAFSHRVAAGLLMLLVAAIAFGTRQVRSDYPALYRVDAVAFGLILMQALIGGAVVLSRLDLWTTLAHSALMALLFVCLADACRQVLQQRQLRRSELPRPATAMAAPSGD